MTAAPVLKYSGAKWTVADWIIAQLPPHGCYLEPFFGSGAVFFTKPPSPVETINDLSGDIVNLFRVLREDTEALCAAVSLTPWSREEYEQSKTGRAEACSDLERARRFLVGSWQQIGIRYGASEWTGGWRSTKDTGCNPVMTWKVLPVRIRVAADRLRDAQIENRPALDVLTRYSDPDVLVYADPPYVLETRSRKLYRHEMSTADHLALLDALDAHPGPVLLSGYDCEIYTKGLKHWRRLTRPARAQSGALRTEVLWLNPECVQRLDAGRLPL